MTNIDNEVGRRYSQAFAQYAKLTEAFVKQCDPAELAGTLSAWFQSSIGVNGCDLTHHGMPSQAMHLGRLMELAAQCQSLQSRLAAHWAEVGRSVASAFAADLAPPPPDIDATQWAARRYAAWIDRAESAYAESARAPRFANLIGELTNALYAFKAEQAALIELWARQFNQPTRSELDALHLQIKELRLEVRELRRRAGGTA